MVKSKMRIPWGWWSHFNHPGHLTCASYHPERWGRSSMTWLSKLCPVTWGTSLNSFNLTYFQGVSEEFDLKQCWWKITNEDINWSDMKGNMHRRRGEWCWAVSREPCRCPRVMKAKVGSGRRQPLLDTFLCDASQHISKLTPYLVCS